MSGVFTKGDFTDWSNHPITQELFMQLAEAAENHASEMIRRPTPDTNRDQFIRGIVFAIDHTIGWKPLLVDPLNDDEDKIEEDYDEA